MSHNYLNDPFGEYRGYNTRYTPHEKHAIVVIRQFYNQEIDKNTFAKEMLEIRETIMALRTKDKDGNPIFDQDVPIWLFDFIAFYFLRWNDYKLIQEAAINNPQLKQDPRWPTIIDRAAIQEMELKKTMKHCIDEWDRIHTP